MKTRSAPIEPPNIAASVKARRNARIGSPFRTSELQATLGEEVNSNPSTIGTSFNTVLTPTVVDKPQGDDLAIKPRSGGQKLLKQSWTADDRRLFFQGVRLFGRNFNELTRFIRSRGHRGRSLSDAGGVQVPANSLVNSVVPGGSAASVVIPGQSTGGSGCPVGITAQGDSMSGGGGRTKDQVRLFYLQTWYKLRRYVKYPDSVPQHVREVYAIINWSMMRARIKKPLDNRLGEKLNELVHYGSTCVKYNGRRFLIRTPVCPSLKHINHISAPTQEFCFPDDVWVELVPSTQAVAWRVLEAEQNPRLRLRVDINRQLSDIISLVEAKWIFQTERISSLLSLSKSIANCRVPPKPSNCRGQEQLLLRFPKEQKVDGAISLREISRTRSVDIALNAYLARMQEKTSSQTQSSTETATAPGDETEVVISELNGANGQTGEPTKPGEAGGTTKIIPAALQPLPVYRSASSVVHLDLRETGNRLTCGITFEEARGIKMIVIYLALGCPGRIRFEYDFVWPINATETAGNCAIQQRTSICKDANDDGISNGLRRLLHLNASDYLSLKEWNTPNKSHSNGGSTPKSLIRPRSDENMHLPPASIQPPIPFSSVTVTSPAAIAVSTHPTEVTPVSGHEAYVVCQPQGQNAKLFVARQLNVQGPLPPPTSAGVTYIPPRSVHQTPPAVVMTTLTPQQPTVFEAPKSSLHALRTFNRKQVQRSRTRQQIKSVTVNTAINTPSDFVSEDNSLNTPPNSYRDQSFIVAPSPFATTHHAGVQANNPQIWTNEMGMQIVPPLQTQLDSIHQVQTEQSELAFPFSLDGYSHTSSTSDTMKSLLNAVMHIAPHTADLPQTTEEKQQDLRFPLSNDRVPFHLQQEQNLYSTSVAASVMQPNVSEFSTHQTTNFHMMPPHDDSFLGTSINQHHTGPIDAAFLSDSLARKIFQEMSQVSTDMSLNKYEKQMTTDGAMLVGGSDQNTSFQSTMQRNHLVTPPGFRMSSTTAYQLTDHHQQPSPSPTKLDYETEPMECMQFGSFSTSNNQPE